VRRKLVAANWKMNGASAANAAWMEAFVNRRPGCDTVICAPYVYLPQLIARLGTAGVAIGAQNLSEHVPGAFTGEVAAEMLLDTGVRWVIVGHSERRALYGESDAIVAGKAARAVGCGLSPIVCVGETLAQREAGATLAVVRAQLDAVLAKVNVAQLCAGAIAYEPVWAIGTGRTATPEQAQEVHAAIRAHLADRDRAGAAALRVLYGGSVKPANAAELFSQADIDGGLIGGASLVVADFLAICAAAS
jgi:triosephosphate isomerase (TIM)